MEDKVLRKKLTKLLQRYEKRIKLLSQEQQYVSEAKEMEIDGIISAFSNVIRDINRILKEA